MNLLPVSCGSSICVNCKHYGPSPSWDIVAQLVKKFPIFYATWMLVTVFRGTCDGILISASWILCIPSHTLYMKIHLHIIPRFPEWSLPPQIFWLKFFLCFLSPPCMLHISYHLILCNLFAIIIFSEQYKLWISTAGFLDFVHCLIFWTGSVSVLRWRVGNTISVMSSDRQNVSNEPNWLYTSDHSTWGGKHPVFEMCFSHNKRQWTQCRKQEVMIVINSSEPVRIGLTNYEVPYYRYVIFSMFLLFSLGSKFSPQDIILFG